VKSFRELIVWQKSMALVTRAYTLTGRFPQDERFGLISQIRRSAVSIPSNIAEGFGRHSTNDYLRFLQISSASVYELETQLEISANLGFTTRDEFEEFHALTHEISRMLGALISKLEGLSPK